MRCSALVLAAALSACATPGSSQMGTISNLSRVEGPYTACEHRVPEQVCTKHHPELIPKFKAVNDWCGPHEVPESQCFECHPELTFEAFPALPASADVRLASKAGEDPGPLGSLAVPGKVTVLEFYADWCSACRELDLHLTRRLARGDGFAVRKLNVVDWDTPIAQAHLKNVKGLPYTVVLGPDGQERVRLQGLDEAALDAAIDGGAR